MVTVQIMFKLMWLTTFCFIDVFMGTDSYLHASYKQANMFQGLHGQPNTTWQFVLFLKNLIGSITTIVIFIQSQFDYLETTVDSREPAH